MIPYAFGSSDGLFNLGSALSFVQVAAAGRLRRDERPLLRMGPVRKEPRKRRFESI
jgi:L-asparaginase